MEHDNPKDSYQFRKRAEEILKNKKAKLTVMPNEAELLRIVHELEVYHIELELQNEELRLSRERSENIAQKFTSLYDFAPIGYYTLSKEGKILELNLIGAKLLGNQRSTLKDKLFSRYLPESQIVAFNFFLNKAFQCKNKVVTEILINRSGDSPIFAQLTAVVEEEPGQNCLLTVLDISERKKAESELEEVAKEMKSLNAQKDMFFSIIAHDLKIPFNSIMGYSELLLMEVESKDYIAVEEYARIVLSSSKRAIDLLGNLMEWASSQTGRMIYQPEKISLVDVVNDVTDIFDQIAYQKDITITKDISDECEFLADKDMIGTVVRNLVSNAVKFTKPGGEVTIFTQVSPRSFTLCVRDSGIGIENHVLDKLFKGNAVYTTLGTKDEKGSGLGLMLCQEFVEKHSGKIWAETEKDKGSTFFVEFPRKAENFLIQ